jgi:hypothetical protein
MKFLSFRFSIGSQCAGHRSRPAVGGYIGIARFRESWLILSPS